MSKKLGTIFVSPESPIIDAVKVIDAHAARIALAVDQRRRLVGTVTDGDVRRGILRGVSLADPVGRIMSARPRFAREHDDKRSVVAAMKQHGIYHMPVVNAAGVVVGLEVMAELLNPGDRPHWVVLMAGGLGTRLRPLTDHTPKPLIPVGRKPILETILKNFVDQGFKKFFLAVNYKNAMLKDHFGDGARWGVDIHYLKESERLGTAGALGLLPAGPQHPLIVMNGDLLTNVNFTQLLDFHTENRADATMCVREYDLQVPYGVVRIQRLAIEGIDEKPVHRFFINAGIYVLEPRVLKLMPKRTKKRRVDMPELFDAVIRDRGQAVAFPIREYWLDIGQIDDLDRARGEFRKHFKK